MRVGGAAAITALTLSALGLAPRLVGCVGDDDLGRLLLERLRAASIPTGDVRAVPSSATGVSVAFEAPSRERSFLMSLGSLTTFDRSMVPRDALVARLVLLCGYFDVPALRGEETATMLETIRHAGGRSLLDVGWAPDGWTEPTRTEVLELLPLVDVFLPNEAEALHLSGEPEVRAAARALQERSGGWIIVKRGLEGCLAAGPDDALAAKPAPRVRMVDTTGAGDAFNGALMLRLSEGAAVPDALGFAARVASTVVARPSSDRYPDRAGLID